MGLFGSDKPAPQGQVAQPQSVDEQAISRYRYMLKTAPPDQFAEAVRTVARGEALLAPTVTRRLIEAFVTRPRAAESDRLAELTEREREVLRQVARGLSNAEIAEVLVLGETTVKTHVNRILTKLGLRDRTQAAVLAYETGLIEPGAGDQ